MMVPSPYGVRWTSKLIYRDVRGLAINCASKLKSFFSTPADMSVSTSHVQVELEPSIDTEVLHDALSLSFERSFDSSADDDSSLTVPTQVTEGSADPVNTLYGLLATKLKTLYNSRDRDAPHEERWAFRGAWLLLDMATQCCASNPSFNISRGDHPVADEAPLLLELLQYNVTKPPEVPTTKISQMLAMPYTNYCNGSTRRDSGYASLHSPPSPALLWYTVFVGATEHTKTIYAAECLLGHAWPKRDAATVLEVVGNPAKRLSEDESRELRDRLSHLLYPEFGALC